MNAEINIVDRGRWPQLSTSRITVPDYTTARKSMPSGILPDMNIYGPTLIP